MTAAKYVYGVVPETTELPAERGIDGAALELIHGNGMAAIVSAVEGDEVRLGREAMTTHSQVLESALAGGAVLPMRFGIVMADDDAVRDELLGEHEAELHAQLQELADKVELRVRATYDEAQIMREVVAADPDIRRLRESMRGAPEDATYYGRIRLGEMVAAAVERRREADARMILDVLEPFAVAVVTAQPGHERVALDGSFLVQRRKVADFDDALEGVGAAQAGRMRLKLTGPLPPHSFVTLGAGV